MKTYMMPIYVELTARCNLRCLHCYNESGEDNAEITMDDVVALCDATEQSGNHHIVFSGGEPMLHAQFSEFVLYCVKRGLSVTITTNATYVTEETVSPIAGLPIRFQVSINGSVAEVHDKLCGDGAFVKSMAGLKSLIKYFGSSSVSIHSVLSKYNINDTLGMIELCKSLEVGHLSFSALHQLGRAKHSYSDIGLDVLDVLSLNRALEDSGSIIGMSAEGLAIQFPMYTNLCPLAVTDGENTIDYKGIGIAPRIDPHGNAYLCQSFSEYSIGNIRDTPLLAMICTEGGSAQRALLAIQEARHNISQCKSCVWQFECGKGCPALAVMNNGGLDATDGYCRARSHDFLQQLKECADPPVQ